ncbi:hypothetical protein B5P46_11780 [Rhizobium leguminosarum]|uniref:Uncharacterized protein n=1 Tax=Rhizobium leguminosarum TaxID=384 RepID=A0A4Q1UE97_RHILE|nr:hypothetical protein [Rhizobium leguminosarum]RXT29355.1 hypothetical protein B5P46_11780 [Rhizobium leguminosarum]
MAKGGRMKVVWPRGKHLKPAPAGKDLQAIPEQRVRQMVNVIPPRAPMAQPTTATDPRMAPAPAPMTAARLREMLASMPPAPEPEPLLLTREEVETLRELLPPDPTPDPARLTFRGLPVTIIEGNPTPATRELLSRMLRSRKDMMP